VSGAPGAPLPAVCAFRWAAAPPGPEWRAVHLARGWGWANTLWRKEGDPMGDERPAPGGASFAPVQTARAVWDLEVWAAEGVSAGTRYDDRSYERGVLDTLRWLRGEGPQPGGEDRDAR